MFAFIDESGNTGPNLFDADQPIFYSVAVISRRDIDIEYAPDFLRIARSLGKDTLHANELGLGALERVLPELQARIKKDNIRFFLGRIDKKDLVLFKLADTLLDSDDNKAVAWHSYNVRLLRHMLVFKLARLADGSILELFWDALMESKQNASRNKFLTCLEMMQARLPSIPDARSQEIIGHALQWALDHPSAITVQTQRSVRLGHLPHLAIFPSILHAVQRQSEYWGVTVNEIRHDRESLMQTALSKWHDIISNAPVSEIKWVDMTIPVGGAPGSNFRIVNSKESVGVQLADIVLWLLRRETEKGDLNKAGNDFLKRVRRNGEPFELSLGAMEERLKPELDDLMSMPMSEPSIEKGKQLLGELERNRMTAIAQYDSKDGD